MALFKVRYVKHLNPKLTPAVMKCIIRGSHPNIFQSENYEELIDDFSKQYSGENDVVTINLAFAQFCVDRLKRKKKK